MALSPTRFAAAIGFIIPCFLFSPPVYANVVVNGSFEQPNCFWYTGEVGVLPTGWSNAVTCLNNASARRDVGPTPYGNQWIALQFGDAIQQTISGLTVGQTYTLTFAISSGSRNSTLPPHLPALTVSFPSGSATAPQNFTPPDPGQPVGWEFRTWATQTMNFTANDSSVTIRFTYDVSYPLLDTPRVGLDNVAVGVTCSAQVQVSDFTATTGKDINAGISGSTLTLDTMDKHRNPGIQFLAGVTIKEGAIPIKDIHIRYVQNLINSSSTWTYSPKPDVIKVLLPGATFPLLDRVGDDPPPAFYEGDFLETPTDSSSRSVYATDSPHLNAPITWPGTSRQLQGVDASSQFRMFLGCVSEGDSTFQTLATLDWDVRYSGTLNSNGKTFKVGKAAGISAAVTYSLSQESPVQIAPIASKAFTYVDSAP